MDFRPLLAVYQHGVIEAYVIERNGAARKRSRKRRDHALRLLEGKGELPAIVRRIAQAERQRVKQGIAIGPAQRTDGWREFQDLRLADRHVSGTAPLKPRPRSSRRPRRSSAR